MAATIAFLTDPANRYLTGLSLDVAGGARLGMGSCGTGFQSGLYVGDARCQPRQHILTLSSGTACARPGRQLASPAGKF